MRWSCWTEAAAAAAGLALAPLAAAACPMSLAIYTEAESGAELRFRAAAPWEMTGMVTHVFDLALHDGRVLWGEIGQNMGTSRDEGRLYVGCARPGAADAPLDDTQAADCRVWDGVVYALQDGRIAPLPDPDATAPPALVLSDIGRQLRYAAMDGSGPDLWDQFDLTACAE